MQLYSFPIIIKANHTDALMTPDRTFRITKIFTSAIEPNISFINDLRVNNQSQLLERIDLWELSIKKIEDERKIFYEYHKLTDKSIEEIQDYLDEHELSLPDVPKFDIPTLSIASQLKISGIFPVETKIIFIGWTP